MPSGEENRLVRTIPRVLVSGGGLHAAPRFERHAMDAYQDSAMWSALGRKIPTEINEPVIPYHEDWSD